MKVYEMKQEDWQSIARIIDNEFNGSEKTFTAKRIDGKQFYALTTNKCDLASLIRCYIDNEDIVKITRLGDDTESWQEIMPATYVRVNEFLNSKGLKQIL